MDTNAQVHAALKDSAEATQLAAKSDVHTLMAELRALYHRIWGAVNLDVHDWHWQATALKNHVTGEANADDVTPPAGHAADVRSGKSGSTAPAGTALDSPSSVDPPLSEPPTVYRSDAPPGDGSASPAPAGTAELAGDAEPRPLEIK
jgi:hypothetical protein